MQPVLRRMSILGLCLGAGGGLAYLVIINALDKGISTTDRVIAVVIGLAALTVLWRLEFPDGLSRKAWRQPLGRAQVMNVVIGVFGVLSTVVGMMAPRTVVESEAGLIEATVTGTAKQVSDLGKQQAAIGEQLGVGQTTLIRRKIAGTWGEPGCSVVRRIVLTDRALQISTVRVPPGMTPRRWAFTIEAEANEARGGGMRASTITATEREGFSPGTSVKFRYLSDGVSERLVWDSESLQQAAPELVRCG